MNSEVVEMVKRSTLIKSEHLERMNESKSTKRIQKSKIFGQNVSCDEEECGDLYTK